MKTITSYQHHRLAEGRGQDERNGGIVDDNVDIVCHLRLEIRTLGGRHRDEILLEELLEISGSLRVRAAKDICITSDIEDAKRLLDPCARRLRDCVHANKHRDD